MPQKKKRKRDLKSVAESLRDFYVAIGICALALQQTQRALKRDKAAIRVSAYELRDSVRRLQRMQRSLFAELKEAGIE